MTTVLQSNLPTTGVSTSPFSTPKIAVTGRWEGLLGKGCLILELRGDSTASINLKRRVRTVYHPCTWSVVGGTIQLACTRDQSVTFPILSVSENILVLRMGADSPDACELHRTAVNSPSSRS